MSALPSPAAPTLDPPNLDSLPPIPAVPKSDSLTAEIPKDLSPAAPEGAITPTGSDTSARSSGIPGPKPSGLKAPSKIGRPCSGSSKPALPTVPVKNSPDSDLRRDEYRRQKLTDVEEEIDENDDVDFLSRSPTPRKTRNYSDTSVVLTEDTDCFIIGMKVWVGGTKPGQIAYLGETQFAPGEWAGIVLDEPIGKNDGSVSGVRYFQCEPKKGVFSRLTRLTLSPLPEAEAMSASRVMTPPTNGTRKSPVSPAGSTRSLLRTPAMSLNTSMTSLASTAHQDIKVGDRVIVQSSQGSKPGTLRFIGPTDFAKGEWCGVELDDPLGKNDGSVEGKRYFACGPRFGLFAPSSKVSKSPSSRRSTASCVVHKSSGAPGALHRANSRDSMTSMVSATSAASGVRRKSVPKTTLSPNASKSPLQDVIKEKEHHIEQLMKEREIDRSEISRAAALAEKAEGELLSLQQEYEKYRLETEVRFKEQSSFVASLEKQKLEILGQLDDEKKKSEDAQFRFEEESLTKDDIEAANASNISKIEELEASLKEERLKNEKLEQETKRLFETEEILAKIQEEMENLQKTQENTTKNIELKDGEILTLKQKLEESNSVLQQEQNKLKEKTKDIETIIAENNILLAEKETNLEKLKQELNNANKQLKEKHIGNEIVLLKELKKIEMDLSAKTFDCENSSEKCKDLEKKLSTLQAELDSLKASEPETEKEKRWKNNIEEIRTILKATISELLRARKDYAIQLLEKDMSLREKDIKLSYEIMEIQKLKADFAQTIAELQQNSKSCRERYAKQIEMRNIQIEDLLNALQSKSKDLIGRQVFSSRLESENTQHNLLIAKLKSELYVYSNKQSEQNAYIAKLIEELKSAKLKAEEYERKFHSSEKTVSDLKIAKEQQELQFKNIIDASEDSNAQLAIMNEELKKAEVQLNNLRIEMIKKLDASSNIEQELRFTLQHTQDQHKIERNHLEDQLKSSQNTEQLLKTKLEHLTLDSAKIQEQLQLQISDLNKNIEQSEFDYNKQIEINFDKIKELEQILEMAVAEHQQVSGELSRRIEELTSERDQLRNTVKEKAELLVEAEEKAKDYSSLQDSAHEQQVTTLKNTVEEYKRQIEEGHKKIAAQNEEINSLQKAQADLNVALAEETSKLEKTNEETSKLKEEHSQLQNNLQATVENLQKLVKQFEDVQEEKRSMEKLLNEQQNQLSSLTEETKNLKTTNTNISNSILEKDQQLASLSEEMKLLLALKTNLESSNQEKDNKIAALTAQFEEILKEKGTASDTFASQEKKIMELNMELQKIAQEKNKITNDLNENNGELAQLKQDLAIVQEELNKNLQSREEIIAQLKQQIEDTTKEKDNISKSMTDSEQNVSTLNNEIKSLKSVKSKLEEIGEDNEQKLQELKDDLQKLSIENSEKSEKILQLENSIKISEDTVQNLQEDLQKLQQNWEDPKDHPMVKDLTAKLEETSKNLEEMQSELSNLNDRLQAITKTKSTDSEIISAQDETINNLKNEIEKLSGEKLKLNSTLKQNEENLKKLNENFEKNSSELSITIKQKDLELSSLKEQLELVKKEQESSLSTVDEKVHSLTRLSSEFDSLKKDNSDLQNVLKENEEKIAKLKQETQQSGVNSLAQTLKISELEKTIEDNKKTITNLQTNLENLQKQWNQPTDHPVVKEISQKLEANSKLLQEKEDQLSSLSSKIQTIDGENKQLQQTWTQSIQQWKTKLLNLENIRKLATEQCDTIEDHLKNLADKKDVQIVKFEEFKKQVDVDTEDFNSVLEKAQKILIERENELKKEKNAAKDLQKELEQAKVKLAEAAKPAQVSGIPKKAVKESKETCDLASYKKMQEEKEFAIGQVEFLNSIIVDMQQKNEELQTKIQLLENGVLGDSPPGSNMVNISRVVPPRKYCDICEMFDLHETEDCPIQMGEDPVVVNVDMKEKKFPAPRAYCEICEEFGHNTEDCDADETY